MSGWHVDFNDVMCNCCVAVDLGANRSYWNRLLFIDVCGFFMEVFSKKFFKTTFFEFVLVLAKVGVSLVVGLS